MTATMLPITQREVDAVKQKFIAGGGYDAIDGQNKRKEPTSVLRSADAELSMSDRRKLVGGTRDLRRNMSLLGWMIRRHLDYVTSFTFQADTPDEKINEKWEQLVARASHKELYDIAGRHPLCRAVRLAEAHRTVDGDVLAMRMNDGTTQWIEGDRIREGRDLPGSIDREKLVHGVIVGRGGRAAGYVVNRRGAKGITSMTDQTFQFERVVSAKNAYLLGYFDRFDQVRGISPLAAALNELRDTYESFDLARGKMKVAQLAALAIYRETHADDLGPQAAASSDASGYEVDFGRGPALLDLDPGDRAEIIESKTPSIEMQTFATLTIQVALKALDIPYSFFAENFTNYSGSRGAWLQYERACEPKREEVRDYLNAWLRWRTLLFIASGELTGVDPEAMEGHWHARGTPWIDPLKEVQAKIKEIDAGLDTRTRYLRTQGRDVRKVAAELGTEAKLYEAEGVTLATEAVPPVDDELQDIKQERADAKP